MSDNRLPKWAEFQGDLERLGPLVRRFLQGDAGKAFIAAIVAKHSDLASEALDSPAEGTSADYYRGQRAALAWITAQLAQMALLEPQVVERVSSAAHPYLGLSGGDLAS